MLVGAGRKGEGSGCWWEILVEGDIETGWVGGTYRLRRSRRHLVYIRQSVVFNASSLCVLSRLRVPSSIPSVITSRIPGSFSGSVVALSLTLPQVRIPSDIAIFGSQLGLSLPNRRLAIHTAIQEANEDRTQADEKYTAEPEGDKFEGQTGRVLDVGRVDSVDVVRSYSESDSGTSIDAWCVVVGVWSQTGRND
jgi:hypothetical protein